MTNPPAGIEGEWRNLVMRELCDFTCRDSPQKLAHGCSWPACGCPCEITPILADKIIHSLSPMIVRKEQERCIAICAGWLSSYAGYTPEHATASTWAADAIRDITNEIRTPTQGETG